MYESPSRKTPVGIYIALFISRVIILGGIWWMFFRETGTSSVNDGEEMQDETTKYFMGEQVLLEGKMMLADDISQFSHTLTDDSGKIFGLKSFDIALSSYTGAVQIRGEIVGFKQQMPIVQVAQIVGSENSGVASGDTMGDANDSSYVYDDTSWLGIDLQAFPGFTSIKQDDGSIALFDTSKNKVLSITAFDCRAGDVEKDCTTLQTIMKTAESFTNAAGMTFVNQPETNRWFSFYTNKKGYLLIPEPTTQLQTYVSIFEVIDPTVFSSRLDEMKVLCKDINSRLATVSTHEVAIDASGKVTIGLDGSTAGGVAASCTVQGTLSNPTSFSLVTYTGPSTPESAGANDTPLPENKPENTVNTQPQPAKPTAGTTTSVATGIVKDVPSEYATWKSYPSVRGWTMYVEKNVISYNGILQTGKAGCPYRLDMSYRKNGTGTSADSVIYECTPSAAAGLQTEGYTSIGKATGVEFMRKDMTDGLKGVGIYIQ